MTCDPSRIYAETRRLGVHVNKFVNTKRSMLPEPHWSSGRAAEVLDAIVNDSSAFAISPPMQRDESGEMKPIPHYPQYGWIEDELIARFMAKGYKIHEIRAALRRLENKHWIVREHWFDSRCRILTTEAFYLEADHAKDGPKPPNEFQILGVRIKLSPFPWKFLKYLWDQPSKRLLQNEIAEKIWGNELKDVKHTIRDINAEFEKASLRVRIRQRKGSVILELPESC